MVVLGPQHLDQLVRIEAHVHYGEPPPPGQLPFVVAERDSPVLLSAPHGTRTYRNDADEEWHEEDEYTAGMALLLSELCGTSVIANVWRSDACDPNAHGEARCAYKQALRKVVQERHIRWVLDLHGARENNALLGECLIDLGTRKGSRSLPVKQRDKLQRFIESRLGEGTVSLDKIPATGVNRITAYCQESLCIAAVQLEMKPSVRVVYRRPDASAFAKLGPFSAESDQVLAMLQSLADFIDCLKSTVKVTTQASP